MSLQTAREARIEDIERRTTEPSGERPRRCAVAGCHRPTQRSAGNGLSDTHCKRHVEYQRRHGSAWRRSYRMHELAPYRKAADRWLRANRGDYRVARVVSALDALLENSGPCRKAQEVRWLSPEEKANAALARLREAGKTGETLLAITLAVKATQSALGPRGNREFLMVQIAKLTHRQASGTHIRSAAWGNISRYPRAEGIFMRMLGETIEDIAGIVATGEVIEAIKADAAGQR